MISNANNQGVGPNIGTDEESFFQSDRDLELLKLRKLKEGTFGTLGLPIQLNSKVLSFKHIKDSFYVAQSGFSCQKIDVKTGEVKKTFTGHNGPVTNCAVEFVNGEEKHLLTSSWDKTIKKWNIETQELLYTCVFHSDFVKTVLIYGDRFYSSSADGLIGIWDLATGKILGSLSGHSRSVEDLVISPCGRYLFSCSSDSTIRKWDLKEMEQILVLEGHLTSVYQLCANWDDEVLWSVSADKTAIRWDLETGKMDSKLVHPDFVKSIAILNSGQVITGCRDEHIRIWDPATEKTIVKITAHYGEVSALAVDGANIFSGSLDNTIRRWDYKDVIQEHKCIEVLEPMVENLMTEEEERELAELMGL